VGLSARQLFRQCQLLDTPYRLAQHHPGLIEAGDCLLNSDEVRPSHAVKKRVLLGLHEQIFLDQFVNHFTQTADTRLDDAQLHGIAPLGRGNEGKRRWLGQSMLVLVAGSSGRASDVNRLEVKETVERTNRRLTGVKGHVRMMLTGTP